MTQQTSKRLKSIKKTPNILFVMYFIISFVLYHFSGPIYYDTYSFIMFTFNHLGFSILPIIAISVYNAKKEGTVWGRISIIISITFIIIIALGTYGKMISLQLR